MSGRRLLGMLIAMWVLWLAVGLTFTYVIRIGERPINPASLVTPVGLTAVLVYRWRAERRAQQEKPVQSEEERAT